MKKSLSLFVIPALAAAIVYLALHTICGSRQAVNMDMLTGNQVHACHAVLSCLFGFLPCLIYGLAAQWMADNAPAAELPEMDQIPAMQEGQVIIYPSHNCAFRIKSLKVAAILECNNPDYQDYL